MRFTRITFGNGAIAKPGPSQDHVGKRPGRGISVADRAESARRFCIRGFHGKRGSPRYEEPQRSRQFATWKSLTNFEDDKLFYPFSDGVIDLQLTDRDQEEGCKGSFAGDESRNLSLEMEMVHRTLCTIYLLHTLF